MGVCCGMEKGNPVWDACPVLVREGKGARLCEDGDYARVKVGLDVCLLQRLRAQLYWRGASPPLNKKKRSANPHKTQVPIRTGKHLPATNNGPFFQGGIGLQFKLLAQGRELCSS